MRFKTKLTGLLAVLAVGLAITPPAKADSRSGYAYAYNIRVDKTDPKHPVVTYKVSADVTETYVDYAIDGAWQTPGVKATVAANLTDCTATLDLSNVKSKAKISFRVYTVSKKSDVSAPTKIAGPKLGWMPFQLPASLTGTATMHTPAPADQAYDYTPASEVVQAGYDWSSNSTTTGNQYINVYWTKPADKTVTSYDIVMNGVTVAKGLTEDKLTPGTGSNAGKVGIAVNPPVYDHSATEDQVKLMTKVVFNYADGTKGETETVLFYHRPFEAGAASTATLGTTDAATGYTPVTITWSAPAKGKVYGYTIYCVDKNNTARRTPVVDATYGEVLPADLNTYTLKEAGLYGEGYYEVVALMQGIYSKEKGFENTVTMQSNDLTVGQGNLPVPVITEIANFKGRNSVRVTWTVPGFVNPKPNVDGYKFQYFEVYRDGVKVVQADRNSYIGTLVPDGMHTYVVAAVWTKNDTGERVVRKSLPRNLDEPIMRDLAVDQYHLEVVYNYPILTKTEADERGLSANQAYIVDDKYFTREAGDNLTSGTSLKNMVWAEGKYGSRGGMYRHASLKDGKWYLAQMNDGQEPKGIGTAYDQNTPYHNCAGDGLAVESQGIRGGILMHDADNILDGPWARIHTFKPNSNQWVAADQAADGKVNLITSNGEVVFYKQLEALGFMNSTNNAGAAVTDKTWSDFSTIGLNNTFSQWYVDDKETTQVGRVHYVSAKGDLNNNGYAYLALNRLTKMYRIAFGPNHAIRELKEFNLPDNLGPERVTASSGLVYTNSVENYAFPVAGRENEFIWQNRSDQYYWVQDAGSNNPRYTPILTKQDAFCAGGYTFVYNGEVFFIHPSSISSNNIGHFLVDMAERPNTGASHTEADFTKLIPVAAYNQNAVTTERAVNINGMWFGTIDKTEEEGCIYIYQYVPGIRFAKYRFYSTRNFPPAKPNITVSNVYGTDENGYKYLDRFAVKLEMTSPENYHEDGGVKLPDWRLDHYIITATDQEGNVIHQETSLPGYDKNDPYFGTLKWNNWITNKDDENEKNPTRQFDWQQYTITVQPVYANNHDGRIVMGEVAVAQDRNDYEASIGQGSAKVYTDPTNGWKRVDIDFNRAALEEYPEPVSYFEVMRRKPGTDEWETIPYLKLNNNGETVDCPDGRIPGDYTFNQTLEKMPEGSTAPDNGLDKNDIDKAKAMTTGIGDPCVVWYDTRDPDADKYEYKVVAHYAADNDKIHKTAETVFAAIDGGITGVDDITGDSENGYTVYPNPAREQLTVKAPQAIRTVKVFSLSGAMVIDAAGNGDNVQTVNISALTPGVYTLKVNDAKVIKVIKK